MPAHPLQSSPLSLTPVMAQPLSTASQRGPRPRSPLSPVWGAVWLVCASLGALGTWAYAASPSPPNAATTATGQTPPVNAPVPPHAEGTPVAVAQGQYCFDGPHPTDGKTTPGPAWDNAPGRHTHFYPPLDARLFVLRKDCYHFVGDPHDFGFDGATQPYYGAHPIPGGGWCYMVGGHQHAFEPFSPQFVMVGPWNHWQGEFDATFWNHWPYFSTFFKDLYPRYYGAGTWAKEHRKAPPLPPGAWTHAKLKPR